MRNVLKLVEHTNQATKFILCATSFEIHNIIIWCSGCMCNHDFQYFLHLSNKILENPVNCNASHFIDYTLGST